MFLKPRNRGGRWRVSAFTAVAAMAALALVLAACGDDDDGAAATPTATPVELGGDSQPEFMGVRVRPSIPKPDFVLTDTEGEPYDLHAETEGYLTLFYLGYTNCPAECPVHMLDIKNMLEDLPEEVADQIKVVFVTTDPERDTPEAIRRWLDNFDTSFVGLTGDEETLAAVQRSVGVNPAELGEEDEHGDYGVAHAAYVMAFTPDNLAHLVYPYGVTMEVWMHDIEKLVVEGWTGDGS